MSDAMPMMDTDEMPEYAWIRNRETGNTWYVHGTVLERALTYPEDYEILEEDEDGNFLGEEGEIVIPAPAKPPAPAAVDPTPIGGGKRVGKEKPLPVVPLDEDDDF